MMVQIYVMIYYENIADFQQKLNNMADTESMVKKFQQLQEERVRFVNNWFWCQDMNAYTNVNYKHMPITY